MGALDRGRGWVLGGRCHTCKNYDFVIYQVKSSVTPFKCLKLPRARISPLRHGFSPRKITIDCHLHGEGRSVKNLKVYLLVDPKMGGDYVVSSDSNWATSALRRWCFAAWTTRQAQSDCAGSAIKGMSLSQQRYKRLHRCRQLTRVCLPCSILARETCWPGGGA